MDNSIQDMDETFEYSEEKIFSLLEEKKYFQCRDELLKFNAVDGRRHAGIRHAESGGAVSDFAERRVR